MENYLGRSFLIADGDMRPRASMRLPEGTLAVFTLSTSMGLWNPFAKDCVFVSVVKITRSMESFARLPSSSRNADSWEPVSRSPLISNTRGRSVRFFAQSSAAVMLKRLLLYVSSRMVIFVSCRTLKVFERGRNDSRSSAMRLSGLPSFRATPMARRILSTL